MLLKEGVTIGKKYRVVRKIAEGGMGRVWLAMDGTNRYYAVKEPRLDVDASSAAVNVSKIRFEAAVLSKIQHPHIVNLVEAFEVTQQLPVSLPQRPALLVLEYAGDGSYMKYRGASLSNDEILRLFRPVAEAVSYIHKAGVIHRDIKPSNVLLRQSIPKLTDFGTAKYLRDSVKEVVESPGGYTAPEQLRGLSTTASDIWSLGGLLFFLATGRDPIVALQGYPNPQSVPDPRWFNPNVSEAVAKVVRVAMHPNPELRYHTVDAMLQDLFGGGVRAHSAVLTVVVFGTELHVDEAELLIGRNPEGDRLALFRDKDGKLFLGLPDPHRFVSRYHCLIYQQGGKWYIRDLGSLNKTGVYRDGKWHLVWKAHKEVSEPFELRSGDLVSVVFDFDKGPYIQMWVYF